MIDLPAPGRLWLAADLHLSERSPDTNQAFLRFLAQASQDCDALFLVGDIFDAWVGDDLALHAPPPWMVPVLAGLKDCAARCRLYLGRGNRDFLMGKALTDALGAHLLPERVRLHTDDGPVLLSHGDEYCTADHAYQRFRRLVRTPWVQKAFLSLGRPARLAIARWARRRSQRAGRRKPAPIMDVQPDAIVAALRAADCRLMVHGHTHRPAEHRLDIDGRAHRRIVLDDWDLDDARKPRGGWLEISADGVRRRQSGDIASGS